MSLWHSVLSWRVPWHQQALHDFASADMSLHDLGDICLRADPVPRPFGIDHHAGTVFAMIKAACLVRAHRPFKAQPFDFFLEEGLQALGAQGRAAATRIIRGALIDANKNVVRKGGHWGSRGQPMCRGILYHWFHRCPRKQELMDQL